MNAEKKTELKVVKKTQKIRIEPVRPTQIVEVWRLVQDSLIHGNQPYPDTSEDSREVIQSHLFQYLQTQGFAGLIAKIGKKPVGVILGNVTQRPYGRPSRYCYVWCIWVDPSVRKQGVGQQLFSQYSERLKKVGIFHWEAQASEALTNSLTREQGIPVKTLAKVIGGRL